MNRPSILQRAWDLTTAGVAVGAAVTDLVGTELRGGIRLPQVAPSARTESVDDVIARMTELAARFERDWGPDDGVLWFNRLYLAVTRGVKDALAQRDFFHNPEAMNRLDVIFAHLYFDAVDAVDKGEEPRSPSWKVLFEARSRAGVLPIQFAVAGMNAHINHDLPLALLQQWKLISDGRDDAAYADFCAVNQILKREEEKLKPQLEPAMVRQLDRGELAKLDNRLGLWVVEEARERAWEAAKRLWGVRRVKPVVGAWMVSADATVTATSSIVLEPI